MSENVSGVVETTVSAKDVHTKYGVKPVYSFKVNDEWYGGMWTKPDCEKGDAVEFKTTSRVHNDKTYYSVDGVVNVTSRGGGAASSGASNSPASKSNAPNRGYSSPGNQFPINPLDRQMSIIIQSSLNRATEVTLAQYTALTAAAQNKISDDMLWEQIDHLANKFVAKASGQDLLAAEVKVLGDKYEEYQKLLAGEDLDDEAPEE